MSELESLEHMGYKLDVDFIASEDDSKVVKIQWLSAIPKPTKAEIALAELPARKASKIKELKLIARATIETGFTSLALGIPHTYELTPQDQANAFKAKILGLGGGITCTDANGVKTERSHSPAQLDQAFLDGSNWVDSNKTKFWAKLALVNAATTIAEVDTVVF